MLIAEGEPDALAAETALSRADPPFRELATVAIPGAGFPVHRALTDLRRARVRTAWLALDADAAGRNLSDRLADALVRAGIKCMEITLPEGQDLADCLATAGDGSSWLAAAIESAKPRGIRSADVHDIAEASLVRLAGALRRRGLRPEAISAALHAENAHSAARLDEGAIERVVGRTLDWSEAPLWVTDPLAYTDDVRLSPKGRHVLLVLCLRARVDGSRQIGIRRIAELMRCNKDTAKKAIDELLALGRIKAQPGATQRTATTYHLLPWAQAETAEYVQLRGTEVPPTSVLSSEASSLRSQVSTSGRVGHEERCVDCGRRVTAGETATGRCLACNEQVLISRAIDIFDAKEVDAG